MNNKASFLWDCLELPWLGIIYITSTTNILQPAKTANDFKQGDLKEVCSNLLCYLMAVVPSQGNLQRPHRNEAIHLVPCLFVIVFFFVPTNAVKQAHAHKGNHCYGRNAGLLPHIEQLDQCGKQDKGETLSYLPISYTALYMHTHTHTHIYTQVFP